MKKTRILVLSILAILAAATSVYAKLPGNTVIVGNKAFDVSYLFDNSHIDEVNKALNPSTGSISNIFFIDGSQNIKDIFQPTVTKKESDLSGDIIYKSNSYPNGVTYKFNNSEYLYYDKPMIKVNVIANSFNNGYIVNISYNNGFTNTDNINNKLLGTASKIQIKGVDSFDIAASKTLIYFSNSKSVPISVLDSDSNTIAIGQIDLSNIKLGQATDVTCALFKPIGNATSLDTPSGNSQNSGEVVFDGTNIYYTNSSDRGTLYKCNSDGTNNKEISEDKVKYLCINGKDIYYSNLSDNGKLYRIKSDGKREKITISGIDYTVSYVIASSDATNNKVYFINSSDNKVYSFDGVSLTKIDDISAKTLNVIGTDVYYTNINDSNKLYKYSSSTSTSSLATNTPSGGLQQFVGNDPSSLISCAENGDVYKGAVKITINLYNSSTNTSKLDKAAKINVIGNYIYYKSLNDGGKLYRVSIDGGNAELIVSSPIDNVYAINSQTLYYSQNYKINRLDINMDNMGKTNFAVTSLQKSVQPKIIKINDPLSGTLSTLPSTLSVTFADNTTDDVAVFWDLNKLIYNSDETIYNGVLLGGMTVQYHYSQQSEGFSSEPLNNIISNPGNKDTLIVNGGGLQAGDTVKVYNGDVSTIPLGQGIVGVDGKVTISNLNITPNTSLNITRTEKGKKESTMRKLISNKILNSPVITSVTDSDNIYNNADGRDLSIKVDNSSISSLFSKQYVYILPKGTVLNLNSTSSLKSYDLSDTNMWTKASDTNYTSYIGTNVIGSDSVGRTLTTGAYDIYLVGETINGDKYSSDIRSVYVNSEQTAATVTTTVIGDKFKAQEALSDVSVKLSVKTAANSIITDIAKNYTVTVEKNGLDNGDYNFDSTSNAINLKKDYINDLPVGNNEFTVTLTDANGKIISSKFIVNVKEATNFQLAVDVSKITRGYAPSIGISIGISGVDKNGNQITDTTTLNNLVVSVNDIPITNFTISNNVVKLKQDFLNTLATGDAVVKIENEDLGLSETTALNVVDSQAQLTPIIDNFQSFAVGYALNDINVKLNAKDLTGANTTFANINSIEYEGTKIPSNLYSLNNNIVTLKTGLLNELQVGDNSITISGKTSSGSDIKGTLNITVNSAARLNLNLKDSEKDKFTKASSQDLHYDVANYDDNNNIIDKSKVDLTNITLKKGSYTLIKGTDYDVDNINKVITLRKSYLDNLIPGESNISVQLTDLTSNINLTVNDDIPTANSTLKTFAYGSTGADMEINITGIGAVDTSISSNNNIKVVIKSNNATVTSLDRSKYTVTNIDTSNKKATINIKKEYLISLSAAVSPYIIIVSDAGETKSASVTLNVTSVSQLNPVSYTTNSETRSYDSNNGITFIQNTVQDTSIKIGEKDCDGKDITTDLSGINLKLINSTLNLTSDNYSISGDTITIKADFLNALPEGKTTLTLSKDGIVNPAIVNFVR